MKFNNNNRKKKQVSLDPNPHPIQIKGLNGATSVDLRTMRKMFPVGNAIVAQRSLKPMPGQQFCSRMSV